MLYKKGLNMNLFVYGTLKKGFGLNRYLERFNYIGPVITHDSQFLLTSQHGGYPYMCVDGEECTHKVAGELYEIDVSDRDWET